MEYGRFAGSAPHRKDAREYHDRSHHVSDGGCYHGPDLAERRDRSRRAAPRAALHPGCYLLDSGERPAGLEAVRLLLIYGAGSGLGKSMLAREAARILTSRGERCRIIPEEAAPSGHFARYAARIDDGCGDDTGVLLRCALAFAEDCRRFGGITIADSILPCWDWLASAACKPQQAEAFTRELAVAIEDLAPAIVLAEGDLDRALERAVAERGREWAVGLAGLRCESDDPRLLPAYFARLRSLTDAMLPAWPFPRIELNTMGDAADVARVLADWIEARLAAVSSTPI
jgi:hypothetical protein